MNQAACKGMAPSRKAIAGKKDSAGQPAKFIDPFFPGRNQPVGGAQNVCLMCPVRRACKAYAKRTGAEYGVWAGELRKRKKSEGEPDKLYLEDEDDE